VALFLAFVVQVPVPELRPGDLVVMDNLSCHHVARVVQAIESACRNYSSAGIGPGAIEPKGCSTPPDADELSCFAESESRSLNTPTSLAPLRLFHMEWRGRGDRVQ
jgi:hypothetical protein